MESRTWSQSWLVKRKRKYEISSSFCCKYKLISVWLPWIQKFWVYLKRCPVVDLGKKNHFLYSLSFCGWDLWIKLTKERLIREKAYEFCLMLIFACARSHSLKKSKDLKKRLDRTGRVICPFNKAWEIVEILRAKGKGLGILWVVNYGKINTCSKLMKDNGYFVRFCLCGFFLVLSSSLVIKVFLSGLREGDTFTKGNVCSDIL